MSDDYSELTSLESPGTEAFAVLPNDFIDQPEVCRCLHANTSGTADVIFADGQSPVRLRVQAGAVYPYRVKRVLSSSTAQLVAVL